MWGAEGWRTHGEERGGEERPAGNYPGGTTSRQFVEGVRFKLKRRDRQEARRQGGRGDRPTPMVCPTHGVGMEPGRSSGIKCSM